MIFIIADKLQFKFESNRQSNMENFFNFENILVPYNATTGAKQGLHAAIEIAKKTNGKITLITCIETRPLLSFFKKKDKNSLKKEKEIISKELEKIEHHTKSLKNPMTQIILESSFVANDIAEYAGKNNIDLVVIGQTKMSRTDSKYHQSMANYLLQGLTCPLLVVK